jgi:alpha-ketoglutarate-dependent taurine dioxygenase
MAKDRKTIDGSLDLIEKLRMQKITWIQKVDELMAVADKLQKALEQVTAEKDTLFLSGQALAAHSEAVAAQLDEAMGKLHVYEQAENVKDSQNEVAASPDWDALLASQEAHDAAAFAAASPPRAPAATQPPSTKQERKAARSVQISERKEAGKEEERTTAKRTREGAAGEGAAEGAGAPAKKKGAARRLKME